MKDKIKPPSLRGINKIVRTLERALPHARMVERKYEDSVAMLNDHVNNKNDCATPMCHAGWFAYSANMDRTGSKFTNYKSGANLMARELGFRNMVMLMKWAEDNPKLWGNDLGYLLFSDMDAFANKHGVVKSYKLSTIINHWRGVADRLRKAEMKRLAD